MSGSTNGGGLGCRKFVPVLGGEGAKIDPPGDTYDQPLDEMTRVRGKLADHESLEGAVLMTTPGTEWTTPPPPPNVERLMYSTYA